MTTVINNFNNSKKTKVLMFGWEFPPYNSGGLGVACLGLTRSLVKKDIEVDFVLPYKFDLKYDHLNFLFADSQASISIETFNKYHNLISPYSLLKTLNFWQENWKIDFSPDLEFFKQDIFSQVMSYAQKTADLIQGREFDLIHAHDWLTLPAALVAKEKTDKPLIFHVHATEYDRAGDDFEHSKIYQVEKKGLEVADKVVAVSNYTRQILIDKYGGNPAKIEVVHNGIDYFLEKNAEKDNELISNLNQFKQMGRQIILYVGRLTRQKGIEFLLEAMKNVKKINPKALLVIAGSGDMEEELIFKSAKYALSSQVIFAGFMRDEKLRALYKIADLLVMPSVSEPFGLVALEAAIADTPIIVSKNSGASEVLNHSLKVDFWDVEKMAEVILGVLRYPILSSQMRKFSDQEVKRLSWDKAANQVEQVYMGV